MHYLLICDRFVKVSVMLENKKMRTRQVIKYTRLSLSLVFLMIMIIIRDVLMYPISDTILLGYNIVVMSLLSHQDLMKYVWFCFPLTCGIPGYIMTISFIFLIIKRRKINVRQLLPIVIVILLVGVNWGFYGELRNFPNLLSFFSFISIFFYFMHLDDNYVRKDSVDLIKYYSFGIIFTLGVVLCNMITYYGLDAILTGTLRSGALGAADNDASVMKGHLVVNANTMAYYAISVFSSIFVLLSYRKAKSKMWLIIMLLAFVLGLFSFSRTYIACVTFAMFVYFALSNFKSRLRLILLIASFFILIITLFPNVLDAFVEAFLGRFDEDNLSTAGGRMPLFKRYHELWSSNIIYVIFGAGVWGEVNIWSMHSGFQQIYVCLGIVGTFTYLLSFITYFNRNKTKSFMLLLPFLITFVFNQSIQFLAPYSLMLPYIPTLYMMKLR